MGLGSVNVPGASTKGLDEVQQFAQTAMNTAIVAQSAAISATNTANTALQSANAAADLANEAKEEAEEATQNAETLGERVTVVEGTVEQANTKGATAIQTANSAMNTANEAKATADSVMEALQNMIDTLIIPFQNGALVYTGEEQTPTWSCYDPEKMTISGQTLATNAGTYTVTFTPKQLCEWTDGSTDPKDVVWTIGKASVALPSQSGSLVYTGGNQEPTWNNYDSTKLTIGGQRSATNAGTYTATFTPTENFQWENGTTDQKNAVWTIGKAAGSASLSKQSVTLDATKTSDTVVVTRAGTGGITAVSSNTNVVTVSVSGTTITVTAQGEGTATITVNVSGDSNHNASAAKTFTVSVTLVRIYGAEWDGTSTTSWSRTDKSANFSDPVPYVAGATNYGSPFDNLQPWAGMVKSERTGGTVVAIPKFWYKLSLNGKKLKVQIADAPTDGFFVSPAHADRGDGAGERSVVYVGRYHCGASNYKSVSGQKPKASITRSAARTAIHKLGDNIYQMDFVTRFTIWLLYIVEFANWESQGCIGYGCGNNSAAENMGYTDSMPYHTGTTKGSRITYGIGTQYRNIEGLWDNVLDWIDGCYNNANGLNIILNPNNFKDSSNGTPVGMPSSGYPSKFAISNELGFPMFYPEESNGSESTFSCDRWNFSASNPCLCGGGSFSQYRNHGLFYVYYYGASSSNAYIGCRLLELP